MMAAAVVNGGAAWKEREGGRGRWGGPFTTTAEDGSGEDGRERAGGREMGSILQDTLIPFKSVLVGV